MNYNWNWAVFYQPSPTGSGTYLDILLSGLQLTIETALSSWCIAMVLGFLIGIARTIPSRFAQNLGFAYVELFRNVPLLVQLFLWYFVFPEVVPEPFGNWIKSLQNAPFWTAVVCLGFYTSARVAEQVRAGISAIPPGQKMAGSALGLRLPQIYGYVLLPRVLRMIVPPLTSEFLNNTKNTSVALTIGLLELMAQTRAMQEFTFQVFEPFAFATVVYLSINLTIVLISRVIEGRINATGTLGA